MFRCCSTGLLIVIILSNLSCCTGGRRRRNMLWGTKPPGTICSLNRCEQGLSPCMNGGTCTMDDDTCKINCECTDDYDGHLCDNHKTGGNTDSSTVTSVVTSGLTTTLKPLESRTCIAGFVCSHGVCDEVKKAMGQFSCVCEPSWTGIFCNQYILTGQKTIFVPTTHSVEQTTAVSITERDLNLRMCHEKLVCQYGICDELNLVCVCDHGWTGELCASRLCDSECEPGYVCIVQTDDTYVCEPVALPDYTTEQEQQPNKSEQLYLNSDVCSNNTALRPLVERQCLPNFVCTYGKCSGQNLKCECDPGGSGDLCERRCCLNCLFNSTCRLYENGTEFCDCPETRTGRQCEIRKPEPITQGHQDDRYLYVLGACIGVVLLLLLTSLFLLHWMWRRRVMVIMKVVHFFQPYEDDDERLFDAFISYKSSEIDEHFVVHTLYPKLEREMGFKLCVHFRDFVPGDTISNNIINAINNSRRTILLLTPRYVRSDWAQLEYQVAQKEMLKRRHRIVPIVLEDFSDCSSEIDPNLKAIIDSITYIEWPGIEEEKKMKKFWERVRLSMPKTKRKTNESSYQSNGFTNLSYVSSPTEQTHIPSENDCGSQGSLVNQSESVISYVSEEAEEEQNESNARNDFCQSMSSASGTLNNESDHSNWETIDLQTASVKL